MGILEIVLCVLLILMAAVLIVLVLKQSGQEKKLSGTIAGGAETFFGKSKSKSNDRLLSKATTVLGLVFCVVMVALYIIGATVAH